MIEQLLKTLRRKRGFTLMELMIVVAVLAIIAAVLIPQFRGVTNDAKYSRAKSDLRNLKTALILYINEYNRLPDTTDSISIVEDALQGMTNRVVDRIPNDPFSGSQYYYAATNESSSTGTFAIGSVGADGTKNASITAADTVGTIGDDVVATNAANVSGASGDGGAI